MDGPSYAYAQFFGSPSFADAGSPWKSVEKVCRNQEHAIVNTRLQANGDRIGSPETV
jgi:hypothetical protein